MFLFFDPIYLLILGIGLVLSLIASGMVKMAFSRAQQVPLARGLSGAEVARLILRDEGIDGVTVTETRGLLSDHYNPMTRTLALSQAVYHGRDAAAAGVAAHEAGHALQHAHGFALMWVRSILVPFAAFGQGLGPYLVIFGAILAAGEYAFGQPMAIAGVILFGLATLFTLVTVPVEFDASARAKQRLMSLGVINHGEEEAAVRGVLTAAGLTYVAAAITALLQLLYWAWRAGLIGGRRS